MQVEHSEISRIDPNCEVRLGVIRMERQHGVASFRLKHCPRPWISLFETGT